jgi:glutamate-1-semialdehyde 2,1-aminomutase
LAKSIGGGFPIGAFGGKAEYMDVITTGKVLHLGTYNGNPLVMAAARAVLNEVCTPDATRGTEQLNQRLLDACNDIIVSASLPAHTVQLGAKGCITWSVDPVRNYRDFKNTDFLMAELSWLWGVNRGVITPPGLDEQWLVSLAHTTADMDKLVSEFEELAQALRS